MINMADTLTRSQRSHLMSLITSRKTKPELALRSIFRQHGLIYQPKGVYGRPDFADKRMKIAVFIDGCFWHGCPLHYRAPKSNVKYWSEKIRKNKLRDQKVNSKLASDGWQVIRTWEHQVKALQKRNRDRQDNK